MANPVVVFVVEGSWGRRMNLPRGWTEDGRCIEGAESLRGHHCCLLLLDDDEPEIPDCQHANRDPLQPLPVVRHAGSVHHKADDLGNQRTHGLLGSWGRPVLRARFSHLENNAIFIEIGEVLEDPRRAQAFACRFHVEHELDLLDALASVCVTAVLEGDSTAREQWDGIVQQIPDEDVRIDLTKAAATDWDQKLRIVAAHADVLAARAAG